MKKIISGFITFGLIVAVFCSSGWMQHVMSDMTIHGNAHVNECCDYKASNHHVEEMVAVAPLMKVFEIPMGLLVLGLLLFVFNYSIPNVNRAHLPYFFHRFSRGVFQLE